MKEKRGIDRERAVGMEELMNEGVNEGMKE